jgi:hypothetical protein
MSCHINKDGCCPSCCDRGCTICRCNEPDFEAERDQALAEVKRLKALMPHCGQCGQPYLDKACGPTHAALAQPMRMPGEAQRWRERAEEAEATERLAVVVFLRKAVVGLRAPHYRRTHAEKQHGITKAAILEHAADCIERGEHTTDNEGDGA